MRFWPFIVLLVFPAPASGDAFAVAIRVDASRATEELRPIWRFFGADEPNYATLPGGRELLRKLGEIRPKEVYFRAHNLLTSGDGTPDLKWGSTGAYDETPAGEAVYDWSILDGIFDAYLERGVRPFVEIGFMPKALSTRPEPYKHRWRPGAPYSEIYTGWAYPPKDYAKWEELVFHWASHAVERYGESEVKTWYWEVWNEPNIGYWRGTPEEFLRLHDHGIHAVRRALPAARVGGPDTAGGGGKFLRDFLEHCLRGTNHATGKTGTPLDFIAFHAKGAPTFVDGHVRMGIANQLRTIDGAFGVISSFPELRDTPIVIGESDPDGCAACQGPQLGYRNGTMYSSYTAASFARKLDLTEKHGVNLEGALTWAFEFEDQPFFAGFRVLSTNGIDLPVLNVFRMLSRLRGDRVAVQSDGAIALEEILRNGVRERPDVSALAALDRDSVRVLAWHYHDDDVPGPPADVSLTLEGLPEGVRQARMRHLRIDRDHANPFEVWKEMGSPQDPTPDQYRRLQSAARLTMMGNPQAIQVEAGSAKLRFELPRQGVSLLELEWRPSGGGEIPPRG